jgi:class 3 adenylate cyclase
MLHSYLPDSLLHRLGSGGSDLPSVESTPALAAVIIVDISGFTLLTERFEAQGAAAAESLNGLLNDYFDGLVTVISESGGEAVEFSSDAALAMWPVASPSALRDATLQAARCALSVQSFFKSRADVANTHLRVHTGIAAGETWRSMLGGKDGRWHYLVCGPAVREAAAAMAETAPDTVAIAPSALEFVAADCVIGKTDRGALLLRGPEETSLSNRGKLPSPDAPESAVRAFVPREVLARLDAGHIEWLAEFRRITTLFINIDLPKFGTSSTVDQSQVAVLAIQNEIVRYEGSDYDIVEDEKGTMLTATWGGPLLAHEDDAARGVLAGLSIYRVLRRLAVGCSIGITTGQLFCGSRDTRCRRAYTMKGNSMNLAARLARRPEGGVLCDSETVHAAGARVQFEQLGDVSIKGRSRPIGIFRPIAIGGPVAGPDVELVGRDAECARLKALIGALQANAEGRTVVVAGEPGIGKSRLLAYASRVAREAAIQCLMADAESIEQSTAYFVWRRILGQLLDPQGSSNTETLRIALHRGLQSDPALEAKAGLLNSLVPLELPETQVIRELEAAGRAEAVRDLVIHLLLDATSQRALVLILDDAHWFDSASWAVVASAARRLPNVLLLIGTRPLAEPLPPSYEQLLRLEGAVKIELLPLQPRDAQALAARSLGVSALPPSIATLIQTKAEGNPFFTEQLAYSMRDAGDLVIEDGYCRLTRTAENLRRFDVPDTIQGVIMGRIGRLPLRHQLVLKIASVIGRAFPFSILREVYPIEHERLLLRDCLDELAELELLVPHTAEAEMSYVFKHVITQEVAYNLMSFAQRRQLHRAIAQWYETRQAPDLERCLPLLAHHWTRAEDAPVALGYLERASEQAAESHANSEVVRFMSDALALEARAALHSDPRRRSLFEFRLAEGLLKLSRYNESLGHFLSSLRLLGRAVPVGKGRLALAVVCELAVQVLHRLCPWPLAVRGEELKSELLQVSHAHQRIAEIGYWKHDFATLIHSTFCSLNVAERAGTSRELRLAYHVMGFTSGLMTLHRVFRAYHLRSERLARRVPHLETMGFCAQLDTIYYNCNARWIDVYEAGTRGAELFQRLGDRFRWQSCVILQAYGALHQGNLPHARLLFEESYRMVGEEGAVQAQVWSIAGLLATDLRQYGRDQEGRRARLELLVGQGLDHSDAIMCRGLLAIASFRSAKVEEALRNARIATALINKFPPASFHTLLATTFVAELHLALWSEGGQNNTHSSSACIALLGLRRFARICRIGVPGALRLGAQFEWLSGHHWSALRLWRQAAVQAAELGMGHDESLARWELAQHLRERTQERANELDRAVAGFERSGAPVYVEMARNVPR